MQRWMLRATIGTATLLAALIAVGVGAAFLCFALYASLEAATSRVNAALATGGALLVLAILIAVMGLVISRALRRRRRRAARTDDRATRAADALASDLGAVVGEELISLLRTNPRSAAAASLLSGFAIAAFPELRRVIRDLFAGESDR